MLNAISLVFDNITGWWLGSNYQVFPPKHENTLTNYAEHWKIETWFYENKEIYLFKEKEAQNFVPLNWETIFCIVDLW